MPYFRRRRRSPLAPIHSVKNIQDSVSLSVVGGNNTTVALARAVAIQDKANDTFELPTGALIKGVYFFIQMGLEATPPGNVDWYMYKSEAQQPSGAGFAVPGSTGGVSGRNQIFHEGKGIPGNTSNGQLYTWEGAISIPKGFQRFSEGDELVVIARSSVDYSLRVKCIYKWYA